MTITAIQVKELRQRTGAGMMECKKALVETSGDIEAAVVAMRKSGLAKADKKAGRVAAEGAVIVRQSDDNQFAAILEINCETDFVSGGDDFRAFVDAVADAVLVNKPDSMDALNALSVGSQSIEESRRRLIAKIGENVQVRRFELIESAGVLASYLHGSRIGVVVSAAGGDMNLARDIAMHVAAISPHCVSEADVPEELFALRREHHDRGQPARRSSSFKRRATSGSRAHRSPRSRAPSRPPTSSRPNAEGEQNRSLQNLLEHGVTSS